MHKSLHKSLGELVRKLGERLAYYRAREQETADTVASDMGLARSTYFRLEKGEPRNLDGWTLAQLLALAKLEGISLAKLFTSLSGETSKLDDAILKRFSEVPQGDKEALVDSLKGRFAFAPMFSKAQWFTRMFLDMMTHYSEAELAKFECDLHTLIMNRSTDEAELELRSKRVIALTGTILELQAQARIERAQSAKPKQKGVRAGGRK